MAGMLHAERLEPSSRLAAGSVREPVGVCCPGSRDPPATLVLPVSISTT